MITFIAYFACVRGYSFDFKIRKCLYLYLPEVTNDLFIKKYNIKRFV